MPEYGTVGNSRMKVRMLLRNREACGMPIGRMDTEHISCLADFPQCAEENLHQTRRQLTVTTQNGMVFLHCGQSSVVSGLSNWQKGHGLIASSASVVVGRLKWEMKARVSRPI